MARVAQQKVPLALRSSQLVVLAGMAFGLALFYWGGTLPPRGFPALLGLLIFGVLALLRPDLGLLFALFTVPLYLIPASLPGIRASGFALPLHEAALLAVFGATAAGWVWRRVTKNKEQRTGEPENRRTGEPRAESRRAIQAALWYYAPHVLFLLAGGLGVALAVQRGPALIEFRRLIVEPLLFYALITFHSRRAADIGETTFLSQLITVFVLSGALVGLLGLLQYVGLDLVPLLGKKDCFCQNIVLDGGARRVASVYGHPNNLGLYLGRVWPIAAALVFAGIRGKNREPRTENRRTAEPQNRRTAEPQNREPRTENRESQSRVNAFGSWFLVLGSLLCLGGIVVSFSRGAWLGAIAALAVLALPQLRARFGGRLAPALVAGGVVVAALAGLALTLRGDVTSGSTPVRLLLWREALGYIQLHPLGIGLDQFVYYHDPKSGLSLIDPSLIGSSDEFAAHPHNLLLDIWLRLGPLGLLAFGWLLARFLRSSRQRADDPLVLGLLAAMVAALVHGLVDNFYFVPDLALAFWLLVALMEAAGRPADDR